MPQANTAHAEVLEMWVGVAVVLALKDALSRPQPTLEAAPTQFWKTRCGIDRLQTA